MAAGQLVAMEPADSSKSDTTTCNFKLNKSVRIMLGKQANNSMASRISSGYPIRAEHGTENL